MKQACIIWRGTGPHVVRLVPRGIEYLTPAWEHAINASDLAAEALKEWDSYSLPHVKGFFIMASDRLASAAQFSQPRPEGAPKKG